MASFAAAETLPPRHFQAALNGLCKRNYYAGPSDALSLEDLAEALYADSGLGSTEAAVEHLATADQLLRRAAYENWDPTALEEAAAEAQLHGPLVEVFGKVWRAERAKVRRACACEPRDLAGRIHAWRSAARVVARGGGPGGSSTGFAQHSDAAPS